MIAGASSDVGKTTIATMMMHAYKKMGYSVQGFKSGPDYLDPTFHSEITGEKSINLDIEMMGIDGVRDSFQRYSAGKDVAIIEGVMGLYDGKGDDIDNGSSAHLARVLGVPVLLIVNGKGVSTSLAATVLGFEQFDPNLNLKGVIINNVSSKMLYQMLAKSVERYTDVKAYGYLGRYEGLILKSRHLGLYPASEIENFEQSFDDFYQFCSDTVAFEEIARDFVIADSKALESFTKTADVRLAIAKDDAFYFYYEENLAMLRARGVELVEFSPINDEKLPEDIDGIYLGGGYPELYLKELSTNQTMLSAIKSASDNGMPIYAECGGLMYLSTSITDLEGETYQMVGVFSGNSVMTTKLQHFGYVGVELIEDCLLGKKGDILRGHEFHRSKTEFIDCDLVYEIHKSRRPSKKWQGGAYKNNTLGAYAHLHFKAMPERMDNWVMTMRDSRR